VEFGASPETDEPLKVFLENAFARITERIDKGVETGFGGVGLPTAVKDGHGVFIDCRDLIAVEIDETHTLNGDHLSVARLPVLVCLDGGVHLGFDLTHEKREGLERVAGVVPSTSIQYTILRVVPKSCDTSPIVTSDRFGVESFRSFR